ncbi:MAG TPA: PD-(D/E)XK nuclease family protein [Polyangiaceae bacterium]|nr:PD-(D/E)XK nuclease family protein [Polyangiaceae bacterium]
MSPPRSSLLPPPGFGAGGVLVASARQRDELVLLGAPRPRTLRAFLRRAFERASGGLGLADEALCRLATERALVEVAHERGRDVPLAHLAPAFHRTFGQLCRAGVGAAALRATGTRRGRLVADVLERFEALLERAGCVDERQIGHFLARNAGAWAGAGGGPLAVAGRLSFDRSELAWLAALERAGGAGESAIVLPSGAVLGGEDPFEPLEARLLTRAGDPNEAPLVVHAELGAGPAPEIVEAGDVASEARAVAWYALRALDAGASPERVVVASASGEGALADALRQAFDEAGLAFVDPLPPSPQVGGGAVGLLGLLRLAGGPVTRSALADALTNPAIDGRRWAGSDDAAAARRRLLEAAQSLRGVPVSADATGEGFVRWLRERSFRPGGGGEYAVIERVVADLRALRAAPTRRAMLERLGALVRPLGLDLPPAEALGHALAGGGGPSAALRALSEGQRALGALLEAIGRVRRASSLLGSDDEPVEAGALASEIEGALGSLPPGDEGARAGAVSWCAPGEALGVAADLVIVTGATSALEREAAAAADSLLDEATCAALPPWLRPASGAEAALAAHAELAWLLAGASRAVVTYAALDAAGRPSAPASFVRMAGGGRGPDRRVPSSRVDRRSLLVGERAARLRAIALGAEAPPAGVAARAAIEAAREAFFLDPGAPPSPFDGDATRAGAHVAELVGGHAGRPLAVTALEAAARCRFVAFFRSALRLQRDADIEEASDRREYGELVHEALAYAFEALRREPPGATAEALRAVALEAAEQVLIPQHYAGQLRRYTVRRVRRAVASVVDEYLASSSGWRFFAAEQGFGEGEGRGWAPLEVAFEGERVWLRGRIDRLDHAPERAALRAVDYKTGASVAPRKDWGVFAFQPVFYAQAAARELGATELSAAYLSARERVLWRPAEKNQRLEPEAFDRAAERAVGLVREIRRGHFPPRPADPGFCDRCEAREVCRRPPFAPPPPDEAP